MGIEIRISGSTPLEGLSLLASAGSYCMNIPAVADAANNILAAADAAMKPGPHSGGHAPATVPASGAAPAASSAPVRGKNPSPAGVAPAASPAPVQTAAPPAGMFSQVPPNQPPYSATFGAPVTGTDQQQVLPGMGTVTPSPGLGAGALPVSNAPAFTAEQVSKAGADLVTANPAMRTEMQKLFQQYGVQAMTELKPEQLGPFALALRGLGAKI